MKKNFKEVEQLLNRNQVKGEKSSYVDDGRSITDMNVPGFAWYMPKKYTQERQQMIDLKITRKERVAMIFGALAAILPVVIVMILLFFGGFLLISLWLS